MPVRVARSLDWRCGSPREDPMPGKIFGIALVLHLIFCAALGWILMRGEDRMLGQWAEGRVSDSVPASQIVSPAER